MTFERTKEELKKVPVMPVLSYCSVSLLEGFVVDQFANLGGLSYATSFIIIPTLLGAIDWFTEGKLLKALRSDWMRISFEGHLLIMINCIIFFNLTNVAKSFIVKEPWFRRIFYK